MVKWTPGSWSMEEESSESDVLIPWTLLLMNIIIVGVFLTSPVISALSSASGLSRYWFRSLRWSFEVWDSIGLGLVWGDGGGGGILDSGSGSEGGSGWTWDSSLLAFSFDGGVLASRGCIDDCQGGDDWDRVSSMDLDGWRVDSSLVFSFDGVILDSSGGWGDDLNGVSSLNVEAGSGWNWGFTAAFCVDGGGSGILAFGGGKGCWGSPVSDDWDRVSSVALTGGGRVFSSV